MKKEELKMKMSYEVMMLKGMEVEYERYWDKGSNGKKVIVRVNGVIDEKLMEVVSKGMEELGFVRGKGNRRRFRKVMG